VTGELSSIKSKAKVYVGYVTDSAGFQDLDAVVAVFQTESAAREAQNRGAIDSFKEFPLYLWLPEPKTFVELGTYVYEDGPVEDVVNNTRNSWAWNRDPAAQSIPESSTPRPGRKYVHTWGNDPTKVHALHAKKIEEAHRAFEETFEAEAKKVEKLAMLLADADHVEYSGHAVEAYQKQARAVLATGEVEVADG
jgi:hypothetical protein